MIVEKISEMNNLSQFRSGKIFLALLLRPSNIVINQLIIFCKSFFPTTNLPVLIIISRAFKL